MMSKKEIVCRYIDTCYPDYLQDHHSREGETLISGIIFDGMSLDDLVGELWNSLNFSANDVFELFSEQEIKDAIASEFDSYISKDFGLRLMNFGAELEHPESDEEENQEIFLYAYLKW